MLSAPTTLTSAIRYLAGKDLMPTALGTDGLRQLDRDIRAKSVFSARTMSLDYLGDIRDTVQAGLSGDMNMAQMRQQLQEKLDGLQYSPEKHFGTAAEKDIPPAQPNEMRDLSSDRRIDLVLDTNLRMAANMGEEIDGQDADELWSYPCWELLRYFDREVPRGFVRRKEGFDVMPGDSWPERWVRSGGLLSQGRMVARKDDPIWDKLGDSGVFRDGTDSGVPPYAFNSGFDRIAIGRGEAIALGVIGADEEISPRQASLAGKLTEDPINATLADLTAARDELRAAAAKLRQAA